MATNKENQMKRDEKVAECLELLKLIVDHLGLNPQPESGESVVDTTLSSEGE